MKKISFLIILILITGTYVRANNIIIDSISLEGQVVPDKYVFIEFDISWENSWRTNAIPQNYDAAWIFIKFSVAGGEWHQATICQAGHIAPSGCTITPSPDSLGVFIYRDANGYGNVSWQDVGLRWNYGADGIADDAELQVKVFGIEMVYVPAGAFYLGDGAADFRFHRGDDEAIPYQVVSEAAITVGNTSSDLKAIGWGAGTTLIPADFPKGYHAFYCMKYEISNEQYAEFLNTLNRQQQNTRIQTSISGTSVSGIFVMSGAGSYTDRNAIRCDATIPQFGPVHFYCDASTNGTQGPDDGQNVACNYLHWMDLAAYLDWAALRPLSEMEFEKACRGPNASVGHEYAWGNSNIYSSSYTISQVNEADEYLVDLPVYTGNAIYGSTSMILVRCGIFAASSVNHTRQETGATYYGMMEMSGNTTEPAVTANNTAGLSYTGKHGNGLVDSTGNANVDYWPGINGNDQENTANTVYMDTTGVNNAAGSGYRGGCLSAIAKVCETSDRNGTAVRIETRINYTGGRGCRTAP